jgi:UDPglucose 6-dehydrogenase
MLYIVVFGEWHNSWVTAACLSIYHDVTLVSDASKLDIHEPGLDALIERSTAEHRFRRVDWAEFKRARTFFDYGWVAIDTPLDDEDRPQVESVRVACRFAALVTREEIRPGLRRGIVISSQVPLGFCQEIEKEVTGLGPDAKGAMYDIPVAYVPENLRLGNGLETFCHEKRRVIGASDPAFGKQVEDLLAPLHPIGDSPKVIHTDLQTAEMIKHATNAFLATSISLANELAMIASRHGIDAYAVGEAMKAEPRIGRGAYVTPGMGFAGGTLPRDLRALQAAALRGHPDGGTLPQRLVTPLLDAVFAVNEQVYREIDEQLEGDALLLGYSYKADVQTFRRSPAIELVMWSGTNLRTFGFDPPMNDLVPSSDDDPAPDSSMPDPSSLSPLKRVGIVHTRSWPPQVNMERPMKIDTVVVLTARPEFRSLDWTKLPKCRLVLDCCNGVDPDAVLAAGIPYKPLWGPVRMPPLHQP